MIRLPLAAAVLALLAGCGLDPKNFETAPVTVKTAKGPVVCQLYTADIVSWDRSIDRPASMSLAEADAFCVQAGKSQQSHVRVERAFAS